MHPRGYLPTSEELEGLNVDYSPPTKALSYADITITHYAPSDFVTN